MANPLLKTLCCLLVAYIICISHGQENIEIPAIRVPSVPLIVHNPYFSIWSPADNLTSSWTQHWTGKTQAIFSLIRVDGTTYRLIGPSCVSDAQIDAFTQVGYPQVYGLRTIYTYEGAGIRLRLTFNTPKLGYDFDWFRPTTFVEYNMWSTDGRNHSVQIYFDATGQLAVDSDNEGVESFRETTSNNLIDLRIGTKRPQPVLAQVGDDVRINWGYLHLVFSEKGYYWTTDFVMHGWLGNVVKARNMFATSGTIPTLDEPATGQSACTNKENDPVCDCDPKSDWPGLVAATESITVTPSTTPDYYPKTWVYFLLAYDDSPASLGFFGEHLQGAWRRNTYDDRVVTISDLINQMYPAYINFTYMSQSFDTMLVQNSIEAGGMDYAVLVSLAYRQTLGANMAVFYDGKFSSETKAQPFVFSKGCSSSGHTASVVENFPAAPLFLYYNPDAIGAYLRPIFMFANNETYDGDFLSKFPRNVTYSEPYCPHYLGEYPDAELQCWDTQCNPMPVEATADALLMVAGVALASEHRGTIEQDYFALFTRFVQYLVDNGLDPVAQPSLDYPEGGPAHDANLGMKAVIAIGAYAKICSLLGFKESETTYMKIASEYAAKWMKMADDGDHYRLAYDQPGTWSLKSSLFWDQLLGTNLFPEEVYEKEIDEYQRQAEQFGWPLDSDRNTLANLGWIGWVDAFVNDTVHYELMAKLLHWVQETPQRVPLADMFDVADGSQHKYQARAHVGGVFARLVLRNPPPVREQLMKRFRPPWLDQ